ncbi:MAG TPA: hypothetical protein VJ736_11120 [Actinomycetota bacterium]|jgi:hypothetical protein|nr:hypothetical protein [Actinomycetota bacterium]
MKRSNSSTVQYGVPAAAKQAEKRAQAGRRCEVLTCETVLSTYNSSPTCWLHTTATRKHPLAPTADPLR